MSTLSDLYARLSEQEATIERCRPRLDELKMLIGPWVRSQASGGAIPEPIELRKEQAALLSELWKARDVDATRRELGLTENRARRLQERVDMCHAEIRRLEAFPANTPQAAALIKDQIVQEQRIAASLQITLDVIGTPRDLALAGDEMKVIA